ncbi:MAG: GNAT family N-acetyltransferase [bacterium]
MKNEFEIELFSRINTGEWDNFVQESNNGTIFHKQHFLNYHPPARFNRLDLIIRRQGKIAAVIPGIIKQELEDRYYISHGGASFGGLVFKKDLGLREISLIVEKWLDFLKSNGCTKVEIVVPPVFYCEKQNNHMEFVLSQRGFGFKKRELTSVITLPNNPGAVLSIFKNECRTATKKAIKMGVKIKICEDWNNYYRILEKNLKLRHNVSPAHTLDELKDLNVRFPQDILLFGAYIKSHLAGGIVMFKCNNRASMAFYISHDNNFQALRPVNLLFYEVIKWSIDSGCSFLDFGLFTVNMYPNWGLAKFKETFGAQGVFRDYFIKEI